jgi:hypothetical protein
MVPHLRMVTIPQRGHFANIERPEHVQHLLRPLDDLPDL